MKKQPTINTISRKMPTKLFSQIINKFQQNIQNFKNISLQKTESKKTSSGKDNLEYYRSVSDEGVYFDWAGLGFDRYSNQVKW